MELFKQLAKQVRDFRFEPLDLHDKFSYDLPALASTEDRKNLQDSVWAGVIIGVTVPD